MKKYNQLGITPIDSSDTVGDFLDKTIIHIYTEDGVKKVHYFGYGYCSEPEEEKGFRVNEYTWLIASAAEIIDAGGLTKWESDNLDQCKQYIEDCTEAELVDAYLHYDNGNPPAGYLDERCFSEATPDGFYIVNSNPLEFEMYFNVRFNREIVPEEGMDENNVFHDTGDFISPGGFEMVMNGRSVQFDFEDNEGDVDLDDKTCVNFHLYHPDYIVFPELLKVTENDLCNITEVKDAYVYAGEDEDSDAEVVEIQRIAFSLPDGTVVDVSKEALERYNATLQKKRTER